MTSKNINYVLTHTFKKDTFRPGQEEIIESILGGKHTMAIMPTGSGKSLCFQLPALVLEGMTVVLSPLIALMKDQVDNLKKLGINAEYINSSLSRDERTRRYQNLSQGKYKLLFISPERFKKQDFCEIISTQQVSLMVVDEVHCASQWGSDFRPDYSALKEYRKILGGPTIAAFTATATKEVRLDIIRKFGLKEDQISLFNSGIERPNLHLAVEQYYGELDKFAGIVEYLETRKGSAIVYFSLIKSIERFSSFLAEKKIKHMIYHGKLPSSKRRQVQNSFLQGENILMVATNAFGMGVDKADIRTIVHAEIPDSIESYYQEIGRAGRDGKQSECRLFYDESDLAIQLQFLEWKNPDTRFLKKTLTLLQKLGSTLPSYTYEDIQEELVYKNRGDQRLQTVLNLFNRYNFTTGTVETGTLSLTGEGDMTLFDQELVDQKKERDKRRLLSMLKYVKEEDCRRWYIHEYFGVPCFSCDNCDNC